MTDAEILDAFDRVRVWQKGDRRAPHKPLLILLALGRLAQGKPADAEFSDWEHGLKPLLEQFGPSSAASSRHYPFWHLQTDGLWKLTGPAAILDRPPGATPTLNELRRGHVAGGFAPAVLDSIRRNPSLIPQVARRIVEGHFPESLQQDVLEAVGLGAPVAGEPESEEKRRRDPAFRERVLVAYEYRCCVCGHDLRLGHQLVGLEAAHIKWFQAGGPDVESNGLALCSLHHKLFDLGVFTLLPDGYQLVVSQHASGSAEVVSRLLHYHGAGLILPQSRAYYPDGEHLHWHRGQVFKSPGRDL